MILLEGLLIETVHILKRVLIRDHVFAYVNIY